MVYCTECGEQNPDDAEFCVRCGAPLYPERRSRRDWRRHEREMCFGVPIDRRVWGLIFGLIIVLWGVSEFVDFRFNFWPIVAIVFGLIIVAGALRERTPRG
ncbi:MAG: zinc-ribbon domain-containing protein [Candidatus Bathyarchaeia archaeon]